MDSPVMDSLRPSAAAHAASATLRPYTRTAMALHWVSAIIVLGLIAWGAYMTGLPKGDERSWAFGIHKSFGMVALLLVIARSLWRARHPAPPLTGFSSREQRLARIGHRVLYVMLFVVPLVGLASVQFTPYPLKFFGMALPKLGWPDKAINEVLSEAHGFLAWTLAACVFLHVVAALRHQLRGDGVMRRMLPGRSRAAEQGTN